jgi:WD repeat-containing protein 68
LAKHHGFVKIGEFQHEFPPTKIMWVPDAEGNHRDILATSAECLRIWEYSENENTG